MSATTSFNEPSCNGTINFENAEVIVTGRIFDRVNGNRIHYFAASPADKRMSFTGSGLPFANAKQAFDGSPNKGIVVVGIDNSFEIKLMMPNSYYASLGTVLIPPTLYIYFDNGIEERKISIKLSDGIPFRMGTYPNGLTMPRRDAQFYSSMWDLPVRTQEDILRSSAYPLKNKMDENFWGFKPPV